MRDGPPRTLLAFDFGLKRIGIASGDTITSSAAPRPAITVFESGPDWTAIDREVKALQPQLLVVGVPYNADGSPGALTASARGFAAALKNRFGLPVAHVDERWSSLEAGEVLKRARASGERRRRVQKEHIDSAAAAVILNRWFSGEGG